MKVLEGLVEVWNILGTHLPGYSCLCQRLLAYQNISENIGWPGNNNDTCWCFSNASLLLLSFLYFPFLSFLHLLSAATLGLNIADSFPLQKDSADVTSDSAAFGVLFCLKRLSNGTRRHLKAFGYYPLI